MKYNPKKSPYKQLKKHLSQSGRAALIFLDRKTRLVTFDKHSASVVGNPKLGVKVHTSEELVWLEDINYVTEFDYGQDLDIVINNMKYYDKNNNQVIEHIEFL